MLFYSTYISLCQEIRSYDSEVCHSTPYSHKCTVKSPLMELLWIFLCPIVKILLYKWKCATFIIRMISSVKIRNGAARLHFAMSWLLNPCTTRILCRWKFRFLHNIPLMLWLDIPRATEYLLTEWLGFFRNICLTASLLYGDCTVCTLPDSYLLTQQPLFWSFLLRNIRYCNTELIYNK
jgi:hypothetical protein